MSVLATGCVVIVVGFAGGGCLGRGDVGGVCMHSLSVYSQAETHVAYVSSNITPVSYSQTVSPFFLFTEKENHISEHEIMF